MAPATPAAVSPLPTKGMELPTKGMDQPKSFRNLNNRLQNYVLHVQEIETEKACIEKELQEIRSQRERDLENLKKRLTGEIEELRKEYEHEVDQRARLQVLEQEQFQELVKLRGQVKDLADSKIIADQLKIELAKELEITKNAKETLSTQSTQIQALQRKVKNLEKDNRKQTVTLQTQEKELKDLRENNSLLASGRDAQIAELRKQMNASMQQEKLAMKKEADLRVEKAENGVRKHFENVVTGLKAQVKDLSSELESMKSEYDRTCSEYEDSLTVRQSLVDKVSVLEKELRTEKSNWKEEKRNYEDNLERARQARFLKEQEFNDLMDVKISLDAELTAFRTIMEREEDRVGFEHTTTPNSKRKSTENQKSSSKKARQIMASTPLVIKKLDLNTDTIVIENTTEKDISMEGWKVISEVGKQSFTFPDKFVLKSNDSATVVSGKKNKPQGKVKIPNLFWSKKYMWNNQGDAAILINPEGEQVYRITEGMENLNDKMDLVDDDDDDDEQDEKAENSCLIM